MERAAKGVANRRRINIMLLLETRPGLPLQEIAEHLKYNPQTCDEHVRRLVTAGLVNKGRHSGIVPHRLTKRGQIVLKFLKNLE